MMSEQLYRWVKASDKPLELLNHGDRVSVLYRRLPNSLICLEDEGIKRWCFWRLGHGSHQHVKKDDWKDIEWLEPYTPSPVSGSLEEAKEFCAKFVGENDKCTLWEVFEQGMKFAGAAYGKGGGENNALLKELLYWYNEVSAGNVTKNYDIADKVKAYLESSRPSIDIVKELRKVSPFNDPGYNDMYRQGYLNACSKLEELLTQQK